MIDKGTFFLGQTERVGIVQRLAVIHHAVHEIACSDVGVGYVGAQVGQEAPLVALQAVEEGLFIIM